MKDVYRDENGMIRPKSSDINLPESRLPKSTNGLEKLGITVPLTGD